MASCKQTSSALRFSSLARRKEVVREARLVRLALVPPELGPVGHRRTHAGFALLIRIDQLNMSVEEPASFDCGAGVCVPPLVV